MKLKLKCLSACTLFICLIISQAGLSQNLKNKIMSKKILFMVTSHDKKGSTGQATGYYLSEVSHP